MRGKRGEPEQSVQKHPLLLDVVRRSDAGRIWHMRTMGPSVSHWHGKSMLHQLTNTYHHHRACPSCWLRRMRLLSEEEGRNLCRCCPPRPLLLPLLLLFLLQEEHETQ